MSGLHYGVHLPSFADPGALVQRGGPDLSGMAGTGCFVWDQILGALEPPMPIADPWMVLGAALVVHTERIRLAWRSRRSPSGGPRSWPESQSLSTTAPAAA